MRINMRRKGSPVLDGAAGLLFVSAASVIIWLLAAGAVLLGGWLGGWIW